MTDDRRQPENDGKSTGQTGPVAQFSQGMPEVRWRSFGWCERGLPALVCVNPVKTGNHGYMNLQLKPFIYMDISEYFQR